MANKWIVKQGSSVIKEEEKDELTYVFPKNTTDNDIVYTVNVTKDDGCTATTSITVPSGSACKEPAEESYIYVKTNFDDDLCGAYEFFDDSIDFYLNVEFEDELDIYHQYNLKDLGITSANGAKLVAPAGCSFERVMNIYLSTNGSCRGLTSDDDLESLINGGTLTVSQGKVPLTAHCEYVSSKIETSAYRCNVSLKMTVKIVIDGICGDISSNVTDAENEIFVGGKLTLRYESTYPSLENKEIKYDVSYSYKRTPNKVPGYEGDEVENDFKTSFTLSTGKEIGFKEKLILNDIQICEVLGPAHYTSIEPIEFDVDYININSDCCQKICHVNNGLFYWNYDWKNHDQTALQY